MSREKVLWDAMVAYGGVLRPRETDWRVANWPGAEAEPRGVKTAEAAVLWAIVNDPAYGKEAPNAES